MKQGVAKKFVLFDMDGVLLDSELAVFQSLAKTLKTKGIELPEGDFKKYIGKSSMTIAKEIITQYRMPQSPAELLKDHEALRGSFYSDFPELKPMDGVYECLNKLKLKGIHMAVVSSTESHGVLSALNRFDLLKYFNIVLCGDHVKKTKPSPEGYLLAAKMLCAQPEECVIVEDSPLGIEAGKNAGMLVMALKSSVIVQDTSAADYELRTFEDLIRFMWTCS